MRFVTRYKLRERLFEVVLVFFGLLPYAGAGLLVWIIVQAALKLL